MVQTLATIAALDINVRKEIAQETPYLASFLIKVDPMDIQQPEHVAAFQFLLTVLTNFYCAVPCLWSGSRNAFACGLVLENALIIECLLIGRYVKKVGSLTIWKQSSCLQMAESKRALDMRNWSVHSFPQPPKTRNPHVSSWILTDPPIYLAGSFKLYIQ